MRPCSSASRTAVMKLSDGGLISTGAVCSSSGERGMPAISARNWGSKGASLSNWTGTAITRAASPASASICASCSAVSGWAKLSRIIKAPSHWQAVEAFYALFDAGDQVFGFPGRPAHASVIEVVADISYVGPQLCQRFSLGNRGEGDRRKRTSRRFGSNHCLGVKVERLFSIRTFVSIETIQVSELNHDPTNQPLAHKGDGLHPLL